MTDRLELTLFDTAEIRLNGELLTGFRVHKARALLIYLAVTGHAQLRTRLAGLLWGDLPEARAYDNLSKTLTNLRRLVGDFLIIDEHTIGLAQTSHVTSDVQQFEACLNSASTPAGITQLSRAVEIYRGDFLAGFYVRNAPEFEAWLSAQQTRWRERAVQALQQLIDHYSQQGQTGYSVAIDYATRLLTLEPWREEGHQRLMTLLALTGQRAAALAQYETCRAILAEELAVEPTPETTALYEQIRAGELIGKALTTADPPDLSGNLPAHNLPAAQTPFIGREIELNALADLIDDSSVRLITIVGAGGMGKTRLALAAAERQLGQAPFANGIYFVSLARLSRADHIIPAVAEALNFTFYEGDTPQRQLLNYLSSKQMLLILDNFEHLINATESGEPGGVGLVTEILRHAPEVKILTTSRQRLHLHQEQLYPIHGLVVPDETNVQAALASDAVRLFRQTARRISPEFEIEAANLPSLTEICRLVEGMPLGLELAASWVDLLSLVDIVAEIRQNLDFLVTENYDIPDRHRSLRAVFETTWQRLSEIEQQVFAQLSIFRGGFTRDAAQGVVGSSLRTLASLRSKSLLYYSDSLDRYEIHELLRQYGEKQLTLAEGSELYARDRHSDYYCDFLNQHEADLKGPRQQAALVEIEAEGENIRVAWRWAVKRARVENLAQAIEGLGLFYLWRNRLYDGEAMCRLAVEQLPVETSNLEVPARARVLIKVLIWLSTFNRHLGQPERVQQLLHQAQAVQDELTSLDLDIEPERALLLLERAEGLRNSNPGQARELVEQSLALFQALDDHWHRAQALDFLGEVLRPFGLLARSRLVKEEGLALRQSLGDARGLVISLQNLGHTARQEGKLAQSEALFRQAISISQELGDRRQQSLAIYYLAGTLTFDGQFAIALRLFEESLEIHQDLGLPHEPVVMSALLGAVLIHLARYSEARPYLQKGLKLYHQRGHERSVGLVLRGSGRIALAEARYGEAQRLLDESITIFRSSVDLLGLGLALSTRGGVALRQNDPKARDFILESLGIAVETKLFLVYLHALTGTALLLADQGDAERAVELYAVASQYGHVANSRWFEDVVGQHIAAAAATLPPEVVEAAQARGRARDLWETAEELLAELSAEFEVGHG